MNQFLFVWVVHSCNAYIHIHIDANSINKGTSAKILILKGETYVGSYRNLFIFKNIFFLLLIFSNISMMLMKQEINIFKQKDGACAKCTTIV